MAKMTENKIMYDALVQLVNKKMGLMKYAVQSEK
jgi:flagellar basal-body rod protein FlgB